jgi:exopolysaccharide biosynthesis polyprenyl glycosylphosphotransferase
VAVDLVAIAVTVSLVLGPIPPWERVPVQLAVIVATMVALAAQGMYLWRATGGRAVDLQAIGHAVIAGSAAGAVTARLLVVDLSATEYVGTAVVGLSLVSLGRSLYSGWLRAARVSGRFIRPLLLVGANDEAASFVELLRTHPEHGYRLCGVVAPAGQQAVPSGVGLPYLGGLDDAVAALDRCGATGALIASTAVPFQRLQGLTRDLLAAGVDVQLTTGLRGVAHRRLRWQPLAHEPVVGVHTPRGRDPRLHAVGKRALDVVLAGTVLVVSLPVLAAAAIAIKLEDRGPILFRNNRVGEGGQPLGLLKLRTMVPDAERMRDALEAENARHGGPLFKSDRDPRITRVGHFLRQTSLDELPQLVNVLRGEMSLVGPRPALPEEVAQFDEELRSRRLSVRPGITGLWQAEARDNPAFGAYRRLDLFYVENWSLGFDLAILWATAGRVLARAAAAVRSRPVTTAVTHLGTTAAPTGES